MVERRRTTVSIYDSDLERLKSMQRRVSADRDEWVPVFDLIHEMLDAAERKGEGA
jgi:hypothetical protein